MNLGNKSLNKFCLLGFLLSFAMPVVTVMISYAGRRTILTSTLVAVFFGIVVIALIAGLILSIVGVADSKKTGSTGKGLGIAGIVFAVIGLILVILILVMYGVFVWLGNGLMMSN